MSETRELDVIKVGTSNLTIRNEDGTFALDYESFHRIGSQVVKRQEGGRGVVITSSGAIAAGMVALDMKERPNRRTEMPTLQMLATIGNPLLVNAWRDALPGKHVGEMLLTGNELSTHDVNPIARHERDEAIQTAHALLTHDHIPLINENDSVSHTEITFGDNDTLAGLFVAQLAKSRLFGRRADYRCLIRFAMLSDVDGLYADPHDSSTLIRRVDDIKAHRHLAGGNGSMNSTGGMVTKIRAADIATAHGVQAWITNGRAEDALERTFAGEIGTYFPARALAA